MPLKNLLLHLHSSPAMQQNSFLLLTPLPLITSPFLPLFYLFSFAYLTEAIVMSADLCRADVPLEILSYVVILIEAVFVSLCYPISEDGVTAPANAPPLHHLLFLHMWCWWVNSYRTVRLLSHTCQTVPDAETLLLEQQQQQQRKKQQRMVFMVQEEYLLECMHRPWYILCVYINGLRKGLSLQSITSAAQHFSRSK